MVDDKSISEFSKLFNHINGSLILFRRQFEVKLKVSLKLDHHSQLNIK